MVLASHTVQVTIEARARPISTAFTTGSALRYMPHGLRSRGSVALATTLSCASAGNGTISNAIVEAPRSIAALDHHRPRKARTGLLCICQSSISTGLIHNSLAGNSDFVCIEFVVDAGSHDVVGDAGIEGQRSRRVRCWRWDGRNRSQIEIEVLDLGGPIADQTTFEAAADGPARLGVVAADDCVDRVAVAVEPEDRAGGHHFAHRHAAGDISNGIRRRDHAEPRAQGCEPFELLTLLEPGDHRGIVDGADEIRIADDAAAYGVELCALARVMPVSLDPDEQHADEPVVAGLGAADRSIEPARSGGREQLGPAHRVAEGGVGIRLAGAVADGAAEIGTGPGPCCQHRRLERHR